MKHSFTTLIVVALVPAILSIHAGQAFSCPTDSQPVTVDATEEIVYIDTSMIPAGMMPTYTVALHQPTRLHDSTIFPTQFVDYDVPKELLKPRSFDSDSLFHPNQRGNFVIRFRVLDAQENVMRSGTFTLCVQ